jgi:hypothetical protein
LKFPRATQYAAFSEWRRSTAHAQLLQAREGLAQPPARSYQDTLLEVLRWPYEGSALVLSSSNSSREISWTEAGQERLGNADMELGKRTDRMEQAGIWNDAYCRHKVTAPEATMTDSVTVRL